MNLPFTFLGIKFNNAVPDLIMDFIHLFRMPLFFIAAGYFTALLYNVKGPKEAIANRVKRILLPFIIVVLIISPITIISYNWFYAYSNGATITMSYFLNLLVLSNVFSFSPSHFWFLYYLIFFIVLFFVITLPYKKHAFRLIKYERLLIQILENLWYRILFFSLIYFVYLFCTNQIGLETNFSWAMSPSLFLIYFCFYTKGCFIYKSDTLKNMSNASLIQLFIGLSVFLIIAIIPFEMVPKFSMIRRMLFAFSGTLFIFGFMALFLKYFNFHSKSLRYLSDASYYVYIIHLPLLIVFYGLMFKLNMPLILSVFLTFILTILACLFTYHFMVRNSFIGLFLNGKKYNDKTSIQKSFQ